MLDNVRFTPLHLGIIPALSEATRLRLATMTGMRCPVKPGFDLAGITVTTFTSQQSE
jgi:hypothetical protein